MVHAYLEDIRNVTAVNAIDCKFVSVGDRLKILLLDVPPAGTPELPGEGHD
jgi:hypothetical protein